ncbi:hypothetical protein D3C81_174230 [compost metagenome]
MFEIDYIFTTYGMEYAAKRIAKNPSEEIFRMKIGTQGAQVEVTFGINDAKKLIETLTEHVEEVEEHAESSKQFGIV